MSRKSWDRKVDAEFDAIARPAVHALSQLAGELPSWKYAGLHALIADLAFEAAYSRTQLQLGSQPPLVK